MVARGFFFTLSLVCFPIPVSVSEGKLVIHFPSSVLLDSFKTGLVLQGCLLLLLLIYSFKKQ